MINKKVTKSLATNDSKKESSKSFTFRVDPETLSRILTLEKTRSESRSDIIKNAIAVSYEKQIARKINSHIFNYMNKIFGKTSVNTLSFCLGGITKFIPKEDENEVINPFDREDGEFEKKEVVFFQVDSSSCYKSKDPKKKISIHLATYVSEITHEPGNKVKIKFSNQQILSGPIKDFDPQVYLKINNIAIEKNLRTETERGPMEDSSLHVFFECTYPIIMLNEWTTDVEKRLKSLKEFHDLISEEIKNNKELETIKKPVNDRPIMRLSN